MNDLATRAFIADNSPKIKIEGIEFDEYSTYEGEDEYSPASFICFMTGEGEKAYSYGKETKVISATFHLKDSGKDFEQKNISFCGFVQLFDSERKTPIDYICEITPEICFTVQADEDGRFEVSVPMLICEENDGADTVLPTSDENSLLFTFNDIYVDNGFVAEHIGTVLGEVGADGKAENISKENIEYYEYDDAL